MAVQSQAYPVTYSVDYPDRKLNRLTSFFRIFVAIPILIVIILLAGSMEWGKEPAKVAIASGGLVVLPLLLMVLFRQKYPKWWFDWNLALSKFGYRVCSYMALLRDEYPSTDEEQAVHFNMEYPDAKTGINRWLPLVKWFLAIPHYIVLGFLYFALCFVVIIAWFAILFTGRYPKSLFDYVVGVQRWTARVSGYAFLMITDRYPPFDIN
jgi:hypothetical protein